MNSNHKGARRPHKGLRLWTHSRAMAALTYIKQVLVSLREHRMEMLAQRRRAHLLVQRPGRPNRVGILAHQDAVQDAHRAETRYDEALKELHTLNITLLDPLRGQAMLPFLQKKRLAWLLLDLFDEHPLRHWRYQDEADDTRRPWATESEPPSNPSEN